MKNFYSSLVIAFFAVALLSSCTIAKVGGRGAVPILLNQPATNMDLVEHITITKNNNFDYTNSFDVSEYISNQIALKKPDAVINTTILIKVGIDNYFINLFTLGLAQSKKVVIEADLMKNRAGGAQTSAQ